MIESIAFSRFKYGRELRVDARPLDGWRGLGRPDRSHRLDFYELLLVEEGRGMILSDDAPLRVEGPCVLSTAPRQARRVDVHQPFEGHLVVFTPDAVSPGPILPTGGLTLDSTAAGHLRDVVDAMRRELNQPQRDTPEMLASLLSQLLIMVGRLGHSSPCRREPDLLVRLDALIEERFRVEHRASAYASALGITPDHLSAVARAYRGISVKGLILRRLHHEARRLVLHTGMSLAEIAFALGYAEPAHFSRAFRQAAGCAPGRLRRPISEKHK
jgi:AraC family transcriptional regulator, transcriptional activator of pobA